MVVVKRRLNKEAEKECNGTAITTHHTDNRYLNDHG
jgi:hypothetical protein